MTSTSPRRRRPRRSQRPSSGGRPTVCPRTAVLADHHRRPHGHRSIRRENKRDDKQKEARVLYDVDPPGPARRHRRRSAPADLHLLSSGARDGGPRCVDLAHGRRSDRARDRQSVPGGVRHGTADHRAKARIKAARIPYRVPSAEDLPARVSGVLAVLFLVFNEGYLATGPGTDPIRHDLTAEAIRLTRLIGALLPDDGEVASCWR